MSRILLASTVINAASTFPIELSKCLDWGIQVDSIVNTVGAVTANYAVAATGSVLTTLTLVAVLNAAGSNGAAGNSIEIILVAGGTAGSEIVTVVGSNIYVKIQNGASTYTQVRTAINASAPAAALVTAAGTSASFMTAANAPATKTTQGLTLTAVVNNLGQGSLGNAITIAFTPGATAGSEVVTVTGNAISVQIATGVSTVTQVRTAMQASTPCTALVTTTGTSAATVATAAAVNLTGGSDNTGPILTGGVNSTVSIANSSVKITAHGLFTGQVVRLTTSGTLPTGYALSTNYYVFKVDANDIQLFDTAAHALAAVPNANGFSTSTGLVAPTADGTASSTMTVTPTAVSGASVSLSKSMTYLPFYESTNYNTSGTFIPLITLEESSIITANITATGTVMLNAMHASYDFGAAVFAISAGSIQVNVYGNAKKSV